MSSSWDTLPARQSGSVGGSLSKGPLDTAVQHYISQFDAIEKSLKKTSPSWLLAMRRKAMETFSKQGFPTIKQEEWKYTSVRPIIETPFAFDGHLEALSAEEVRPLTFENTFRFVFVNGHFSKELSDFTGLPEGVVVTNLMDAVKNAPSEIEPHLGRLAEFQKNPFCALNTAFLSDGLFVHIKKGCLIEEPIHILHLAQAQGEPTVSFPRHLILLEEKSQATIVESYDGFGITPYFTNTVSEIAVGPGAILQHYRLQDEGFKTYHIATMDVALRRSSSVISHNISLGALLSRCNLNTRLEGEECNVTLSGLYLTASNQHTDFHTRIDHFKPHGTSRQLYKGILDGKSRGIFNGKVVVHPEASHTDAYQTNKNLLLSEGAEADPTPQLEIHNNDVKVGHGSTVGQLDRDQIFYLRSRGIDELSARSLLTFAFASDLIERFRFAPLKRHVRDAVLSHLPKAEIVKGVSLS